MAEGNAAPERDTKDFKFQQLCRVRVTDTPSALPSRRSALLATSSKYGLTFVGVQKGYKVLKTADFYAQDEKHASDRLKHIVTDFPVLADVNVGYEVTHIQLNADESTLAVAITRPEHVVIYLYDVSNFGGQVSGTVQASHMIVGDGNQRVSDLAWNPVDPNLLVICYCTGRLDINVGKDRKASLGSARAKCVCWSPKGKQLVVGREDGQLVQYDPDLNEKKKWDCPNILTAAASEAIDIVWLSTYTFLVAYIALGAQDDDQPSVVMINGAKDGQVTYVDFEDICFGTGEDRERKYLFSFVQKWDMVLAASNNAAEVGIIGKHIENKSTWERWNLDDSARAECPLTDSYADTYPMGFSVDFSSQHPIPLGDEKTHPPSPLMLLLSTEGLILPYHMMYTHQSAPAICAPAQTLQSTVKRPPTGLPSSTTSSQGAVKNLFGTQPASKPADTGFAAASSMAGSTTGAASPFSFGGGLGAPTITGGATVPKFGTGLNLTGSSSKFGSPASFTSTPGTGVPAAKSDQSEAKTQSGFGSFSLTSTTNKSGANAGFSSTPTFGAPVASFNFASSTQGSLGPSTGNPVATDSVPFKTTTASSAVSAGGSGFTYAAKSIDPAPQNTAGFTYAAKITDPSAQNTDFSFKPPATTKSTTPLFGQSSQAPTPTFGLSAPKTAPVSTPTMTSTGLPPFGKMPAESTTGVAGFGPTSTVAAVAPNKPSAGFTGQSSAFTGMPATTIGRPLPKLDNQSSGQGQTGTPKSPTQAPPPPAYPGTGLVPQSPQYAPPPKETPPQYPSDAPQYPSNTQDGSQDTGGETTDDVDKQFSKSILDEIEHFGKELSEFKNKAKRTDFMVGTKDDMKRLKQQTQEMETFCKEIKDTVQDQNKEVQDQKKLVIDMFSMGEECRTRQRMNTDHKYLHLLKTRALDPGSAEKLQQLQLQYQVLDQGLRDVDLILDTQWEDYQDRKKNKTNRVQNPTNDSVYRVLKSNSNLITAQKNKLKELEERLKQLKLYNKTSSWSNSSSSFNRGDTTAELSTLADSLLSESPVKSEREYSVKEEKRVNRDRLERLRDHLCRRNVSLVRSTKPENLSVLKIPDNQVSRSGNRQSQERRQNLPSNSFSAGNFVGMNRRTSPSPQQNKGKQNDNFRAPAQTVRNQNERNKQGVEKDKTEKPTSQAKPTGPVGQGFGMSGRTGQPPAGIPKTVQNAPFTNMQDRQVTKVKEINGIKFEDITPSGSENDVEDTEEDDEYDDEDDSSSESNEQGFGDQYNLTGVSVSGEAFTSTPLTVKATSKESSFKLPGATATSTPVGRKLFGTEEAKPTSTFSFDTAGGSSTTPTFGSQSESSKPQTGFNFSMGGTPSFGSKTETQSAAAKTDQSLPKSSSESKPATGQITGLFGKGRPAPSQSETKPETVAMTTKPVVPFGQSSTASTGSGIFGQAKSTPATAKGFFGEAPTTGSSVIGHPSDSLKPSVEATGDTTEKTPAAPSGGIFGQPPSDSPVLFGKSVSSSTGPTVGFGQSSAPITASSDVTSSVVTATTSSNSAPSVKSKSSEGPSSTSGTSLFGQSVTTTGTSLFGQSAATSAGISLFGQKATTTSASSSSTFGQATTTVSATGMFGQSSSATTSVTGLFGQTSNTTTPSSGLFGQTPSSTNTASGLFGQTPSSMTAASGLFGQMSSTTTTASGLFGQTPGSTTTASGLFGQTTSTTTTASGLFGQTSSTTTTASGLFGQTSSTTTTASGLFGQTSSTTTTASGLFGQTSSTTTPSSGLFGQTPSSTTAASGLFGQTPSTTTATSGLFGQTTTTTESKGLFGQTPASGTGGLFGQAGGGSLFGQTSTSTGTGGLFGSQTTASSTGLFGQSTTSTSGGLFGQSTSTASGGLFGSSGGSGPGTATSGSGFGFGQTSSPGFGKPAFGQASGFGQPASSSSPFGQSNAESGSDGGMFGGLGGKPSEEKANTNVFGTAQPFGTSQANTQGLFGSGSSTTFGAGTSTGGGFAAGAGGGGFSGGSGVASTGFGAAKPQSASGFGSAPSFGSTPAFGGSPGFGGTPAFGSAPGFGGGGTQGGFGSTPAFGSPVGATFGSVAQAGGGESAGFAGFAGGSSPTFGALAQSTDAPTFGSVGQSPPPAAGFGGNASFGSSPSFTGYRG